jgi:hypothetical protein
MQARFEHRPIVSSIDLPGFEISPDALAQTRSISPTATLKFEARLASTAALIAPADVPAMTEKGLRA